MKPGYEQMHPGYKLMKSGIDAWRELAKTGSSHLKVAELNKNWNIYYRPDKDTPRDKWIKCVLIWSIVSKIGGQTLEYFTGRCSILLDGHTEYTYITCNDKNSYNIVLEDNS